MTSLAVITLGGCSSEELSRGFLPRGASEGAQRVQDLWVGGWIAALCVGVLVWGLTIWCMVAYRRKKDDVGLPPQLRYHVPIELCYTVIPVMMIGVLFYYTARDEAILLDTSQKPDVTINVVGKQWSWDFNYVEAEVWESGVQAQLTGKPGVEATLPTLYLPKGKRVEFVLTARDVIHSFWVPAFQQKLDMIPGKVNRLQVVPTEEGTYQGKCAELCGQYHATMLFNVKVVSQEEYDKHMQSLRAKGQTGMLDNSLNRAKLEPGQEGRMQWKPEGKR
ncbi:aa3-type cytochrome oxidase subunit II [Austwickia chelonae]|uniref:cytochrome-c oxidase n=1 Tax=Austwickia chelonae NBRC 105200 TaxID=1184607 RepID=K6VQK0_9MICO|nr:cytochrome c oxidase subunit II [Austwickia chelonae]GAB77645.1 cytochrome c oxidase subunit II [Austwickia chelonae NBRC 105200]